MLPGINLPDRRSTPREGCLTSSLEAIVRALARQAALECSRQVRRDSSGFAETQDETDAGASGLLSCIEI